MALILTYTNKVRQALRQSESFGVDILLLGGIGGIVAALVSMCHYMEAPRGNAVVISLSFTKLPLYTFYSLTRGFTAYIVSLIFTLIYGTIAAHSRVAEKILVPILDILQSLPVLTLLPVIVISMVRIFPARWFGLEIACVFVIFTSQAWNMTFSYYGSVKGIPTALREAAAIQRLKGLQIFWYLELPVSMIGLVWNSMMSMAGGWFIISIEESLTLKGVNYELPGIGSYMNEALLHWNYSAMIAGVLAMIIMIILVDQFFWRPIVVWSERFKLEDTAAADAPSSWVLDLFKHSFVLEMVRKGMRFWHTRAEANRIAKAASQTPAEPSPAPAAPPSAFVRFLRLAGTWITIILLTALAVWGVFLLLHMLLQVPAGDAPLSKGWLAVVWSIFFSFNRVMGCAPDRNPLDRPRRRPDRTFPQVVQPPSADHPDRRQLSRPDDLSRPHPLLPPAENALHARRCRAHLPRHAVVCPFQRHRRRDGHPQRIARSRPNLSHEPLATLDAPLCPRDFPLPPHRPDHRRRRRLERHHRC